MTKTVTHGRVDLALHELRAGKGRPLLHLHALGLRSPDVLPPDLGSWPGPVFALDFTGHGDSSIPSGGGYTPELLIGDIDAAIEEITDPPYGGPSGGVTIVGYGLGAYVGLMAAAARHDAVRGVILCDGPGLVGGGPSPGTPTVQTIDMKMKQPPDQFALLELARDVRPPDYALDFVRLIQAHSDTSNPIAVVARARPEWLDAVVDEIGAATVSLQDALQAFAKV